MPPAGFTLAPTYGVLACYSNNTYLPDSNCTVVYNSGVSVVFTILTPLPTGSTTTITLTTLYADSYNGLGFFINYFQNLRYYFY